MKLRDILEIEKENKNTIHVFKTGVLWNCYERSALYFNNNIEIRQIFDRRLTHIVDNIVFLVIHDKDISKIQKIAVDKDFEIKVVDSKYFKILNVKHKAGFNKWKKQVVQVNKFKNTPNKICIKNNEGLQVSVFNLSVLILKQIQNYNNVYRFSLGDRISKLSIKAVELSITDDSNMDEIFQILTKIQIDIRLSFQLHQINERMWFIINSSLEEIKKYVNAVIGKSKSHC